MAGDRRSSGRVGIAWGCKARLKLGVGSQLWLVQHGEGKGGRHTGPSVNPGTPAHSRTPALSILTVTGQLSLNKKGRKNF